MPNCQEPFHYCFALDMGLVAHLMPRYIGRFLVVKLVATRLMNASQHYSAIDTLYRGMGVPPHSINLLHVDDDPALMEMAAEFLERVDDRITVDTATGAKEGLDLLTEEGYDCIISDYEMPGMDGIEFLETVREEEMDLPFVLYTGKGSEEVASDAVSAGVSDYLQKESGTEQYTVLANRVINLVSQYEAETRVEQYAEAEAESEQYRQQLAETIADPTLTNGAKIDRLLEIGCERFGVENGHLVVIDEGNGHHEVISVQGSDIVEKGVADLSNTYCRRTIESDDILDVSHAGEQGWDGDPAYESFGLDCYIGGTLTVQDRLFGTLCFVDTDPRKPFSSNEKVFFHLLLQWFTQMLERRRRLQQADVIFEHTQDALFLVDVENDERFTFDSVNRAYEELTDRSKADLRGRSPRELLGEEQGAEVEARFRECVESQTPIEFEEQLTLDGQPTDCQMRLAPIVEGDTVVQLFGATREVT